MKNRFENVLGVTNEGLLDKYVDLMEEVNKIPGSREKALVITNIEAAALWTGAALAVSDSLLETVSEDRKNEIKKRLVHEFCLADVYANKFTNLLAEIERLSGSREKALVITNLEQSAMWLAIAQK